MRVVRRMFGGGKQGIARARRPGAGRLGWSSVCADVRRKSSRGKRVKYASRCAALDPRWLSIARACLAAECRAFGVGREVRGRLAAEVDVS